MDIVLARTFLTVLATRSFVTAAEALFVSQSAVSLRIQKLEEILGKPLLKRSKSGIEMTVHGEQFEEYARAFLQLWDEALYQTSLPDGFDSVISLSCEDSLWPELSATWVRNLSKEMGTTTIKFRIDDPETIMRRLVRGNVDIAVIYSPQIRPGLKAERILEDQLVLVGSKKAVEQGWQENYVYCNWGQEFAIAHSRWFPDLKPPQLTLGVGTSLPRFLMEADKAAYLPYRMADDYVANGDLQFVKNIPRFSFPAYAIWTENTRSDKIDNAIEQLRIAADNAPWLDVT